MRYFIFTMLMAVGAVSATFAQTTATYDFENLTVGNIHGQDGWQCYGSSHSGSSWSSINTTGGRVVNSPTSGGYAGSKSFDLAYYGVISLSRKNDSNWSFPSLGTNGTVTIEATTQMNYWGQHFYLGYDKNNDGNSRANLSASHLLLAGRDANELGIGFGAFKANNAVYLYNATGVVAATVTMPVAIQSGMTRYRLVIDMSANNGAGSGTLYYKHLTTNQTNWTALATNVNMGFNTASANQDNPANINMIDVHVDKDNPSLDDISISVTGNAGLYGANVIIPDGDLTPSTADNTDFGTSTGNAVNKTFEIRNTAASGSLVVSGVTFTGTNASEFTLVNAPTFPLTLAAGGSQNITVQFLPTAEGTRNATLNVATNDPETPTYDVALTGTRFTPGAALHFDGVNDYVELPSGFGNNFSGGKVSVEAWVYIDQNTNWLTIAKNWSGTGGAFHFGLFTNTQKLELQVWQGNGTWVGLQAPNAFPLNSWQHAAFTADGSKLRLFVNGVEVASTNYNGTLKINNEPTFIGVKSAGDGTNTPSVGEPGWFKGKMDEVRFWNRGLTACEIQERMNCELSGQQTGLVAYYQFNQGQSDASNTNVATLTDASGNGRNGTLRNFALSGTASNWKSAGGVTTGTACTSREIALKGNNVDIADGDNTPATADGTDMGQTPSGTPNTKTFAIANTGTGSLTISGISFTGTHASEFSASGVTSFPLTIAANSTTNITVNHSTTGSGLRTATMNIQSNDCDEATYDVSLQASGVIPLPNCDAALTSPANGVINVSLSSSLTWTAATGGATGYKLKIGTTATGSEFMALTDVGNVTTYTPASGFVGGTTYYVTVVPYSAGGDAIGCTTYSFTTTQAQNSLHFDGDNDFVQLANPLTVGSGDFTAEFWVKVPKVGNGGLTAGERVGLLLGAYPSNQHFNLELHGAGQTRFWWNGGQHQVWGTKDLRDETWHHLAFVRNTATNQFYTYVDGILEASQTGVGSNLTTPATYRIGGDNRAADGGVNFHGDMDEVRIWSVARSQADIQANKYTNLAGNETGLVAYYQFNQGVAGANNAGVTTAISKTGAHTGTLNNFGLNGNATNWVTSKNWSAPQANIKATIPPTTACLGGDLFVPIIVENAAGIGSYSLTIDYEEAKLGFVSVHSNHPSLETGGHTFNHNATNGNLYLTWTAGTSQSATVPNNDTLLLLRFTANSVGKVNFKWDITTNGANEFADLTATVMPTDFYNGEGTVHPNPTVALTAVTEPTICAGTAASFSATGAETPLKARYVRLTQNMNEHINLMELRAIEAGTGNNVALNKTVTITSYWGNNTQHPSSALVDGNIDSQGGMVANGYQNPFIGEYIEVDLGAEYELSAIEVVNRYDCCQYRSANFTLDLRNTAKTVVYQRNIDAYQNKDYNFTSTWAIPTQLGSNAYEFFINGVSQGAKSANNTFTTTALTHNSVVTVKGTSLLGCSSTSNGITTTVNPVPTPVVTPSKNTICEGESVTFTAAGGDAYEFLVNGVSQGAMSATTTFTTSALKNGDAVTVKAAESAITPLKARYVRLTQNMSEHINLMELRAIEAGTGNNVALNKAVTITSYWESTNTYHPSSALVDGNINSQGGMAHNGYNGVSLIGEYIEVDLGAEYELSEIQVVNRYDCCQYRSANFTLALRNTAKAIVYERNIDAYQNQNYNFTSTWTIPSQLGCETVSAPAVITVNPLPSAQMTASASTICAGLPVTFSALTNVANATYEYFVNTTSQGAGTSADFTSATLTNTDAVSVKVTASGCSTTSAGVVMQVETPPTPTLTVNKTTICEGESINLTASGAATYQFLVNGLAVGTSGTANTYAATNLANGDKVSVQGATTLGCKVESASTTIAVNPLPTPTLTVPATTICQGENTTFTVTGGSTYEFFVNGNSQGTASATATFSSAALANNDAVTVKATTASGCSATSSATTMTVNALPTAGLTASATTVCAGESVTFTATGGTMYEFFVGGTSQGAPSATNTLTTTTLTNGNNVTVKVTNANGCYKESSAVAMTVNALPTPALTASATSICEGTSATFTATGGSTYEFFVNGNSQGTPSTVNTFTSTTLAHNDAVTVKAITASGCSATSSATTMTVQPTPIAGLTASKNTVCADESVTFTATGGATYEFFVNGTSQGAASTANTFTSTTLANNSTVTVKAINTNGCYATSAGSTVAVLPKPTATLSATSTAICNGQSVTFTANGGSTYQFFVNGTPTGTASTSNVYTTTAINNGDVVTATVTNTNGCSANATALNMAVTSAFTTALTAPVTEACAGTPLIFNASVASTSNSALDFTGGTGGAPKYVSIPDAASLDMTNSLTLEAWIYLTNATGEQTIVSKNRANGGDGYFIGLINGAFFGGLNSHPSNLYVLSTTQVPLNTWTHVAGTFDGLTMKLYVNGALVTQQNSNTGSSFSLGNSSEPLCIGNAGAGLFYRALQGAADEVRVWNTTRTQAEIQANMGKSINPQAGLAAYYKMNEATGTTTADASGNGNNGSLVGAPAWVNAAATPIFNYNYEFFVNGVAAQNGSSTSFSPNNLANNAAVTVRATDLVAGCASTSNAVAVTINALPTVALTPSATTICATTPVTFTASGGDAYEFKLNNTSQGASSATNTFTTNTLTASDVVEVVATNAKGCTATTNASVTVNPLPTIALTTLDSTLCAGGTFSFTANGNGDTYEFFVNNASQGAASATTTKTFTTANLPSGSVVTAKAYIAATGCTAQSKGVTSTVYSLPVINIAASATEVCSGTSVILTGSGEYSSYEFFVNGSSQGAPSSDGTFTSTTFANGAVVSVKATDANGCEQTSSGITLVVNNCNVTGTLTYGDAGSTPLDNVSIALKNSSNGNTIATGKTDINGVFGFTNVPSGSYSVEITNINKPFGGVNATDALAILHDFVQTPGLLLTGLHKTVGDVLQPQTSPVLNAQDALQTMKRFTNIISLFDIADWQFEKPTVVVSTAPVQQNIKGLVAGDVNGSHIPAAGRKAPTVFLEEQGALPYHALDVLNIPVRVADVTTIGAASLLLNFPADAMNVQSVRMADGSTPVFAVDGDQLYLAWADLNALDLQAGDVFFYLQVQMLNPVAMPLAFDIEAISEIADHDAQPLVNTTLWFPALQAAVSNTTANANAATLDKTTAEGKTTNALPTVVSLTAAPNPLTDQTTLRYELPTEAKVVLQLVGNAGESVQTIVNATQSAGKHEVALDATRLAAGVYLVQLTATNQENIANKVVRILVVR